MRPPTSRSISGELSGNRLSARRAETRNVFGCRSRRGPRGWPRRWRRRRAAPARLRAKFAMPKTRPSRSRTAPQSAVGRARTSMRPMSTRTSLTPRSASRLSHVPRQPGDEPRAVVPLEGDLLIVDDDGFHVMCSPVRHARAASAARCPLMTALSIVPGRPVSIQSPASQSPATPVRGRGARRLAGRQRKGRAASRRTAVARTRRAPRARGSASRTSPAAIAVSSSFDSAVSAVAPLDDERQVRRLAAEGHPLVEDPLHRAPGQPHERRRPLPRRSYHRLTVTIGIEAMARRGRQRGRQRGRRRRAEERPQGEPRHRGDDRGSPGSVRRGCPLRRSGRRRGARGPVRSAGPGRPAPR